MRTGAGMRRSALLASAACALAVAPAASAQQAPSLLAAAESAYAAGGAAQAERLYAAVLAERPDDARALFRLGQLRARRAPVDAVRLFERYLVLQPRDAWGWMALGDALARAGRVPEAEAAFDHAETIAPGERDVAVGRARALALAGRPEQAASAYERWLARAPRDAEAWRELGEQWRRAGALHESANAYERSLALEPHEPTRRRLVAVRALIRPTLEPTVALARDSDANTSFRVRVAADASLARGRVALAGAQRTVRDGAGASLAVREVAVTAEQAPHPSLRVDGALGVALPGDTSVTDAPGAEPVGSLRARWRPSLRGPVLEARGSRQLLDATVPLALSRVVRTEGLARAELPVAGPLRVRGSARVAQLAAADDTNTRAGFSAGLLVRATPLIDLSLDGQQIRFDHASTSGYFAPREMRLAEMGAYSEREFANGVVLALDAGAGVQRVSVFELTTPGLAVGPPTGTPGQGNGGSSGSGSTIDTSSAPGTTAGPGTGPGTTPAPGAPPGAGRPVVGESSRGWDPTLRLWAQLVIPVRSGSQLRLELDTYDARAAEAAASTGWRYLSLSAGLRVAF